MHLWESPVFCISPHPGWVGRAPVAGPGRACHPGCCVLQAGAWAGTVPLPISSSGTAARSGHVCAAFWLLLVLKNLCSAFTVPSPGLLISALTTLALLGHHQLVVPIPNAEPPDKVVALACSWLLFLLPRGSGLRPGICKCPGQASSCLPGQAGCWAVAPQRCAHSAPHI